MANVNEVVGQGDGAIKGRMLFDLGYLFYCWFGKGTLSKNEYAQMLRAERKRRKAARKKK